MLIDIICQFVDSSKNHRIDSSARLKDPMGNLVIKAIENLIALLITWVALRLAFLELIWICLSKDINIENK